MTSQTPWLILNLSPDAGDAAIRKAWLTALQAAPPERDPIRFQAVQEAYTAIRDARARANLRVKSLTHPPESPAQAVQELLSIPGILKVPQPPSFLSYLQACVSPT